MEKKDNSSQQVNFKQFQDLQLEKIIFKKYCFLGTQMLIKMCLLALMIIAFSLTK